MVVSGAVLPERLAVVPLTALALGDDLVPTAGSWDLSGGRARFHPRFAPTPGTCLAVVALGESGWSEIGRVPVPSIRRDPQAVVSAIHPGADTVPANLLRFAIEFTAPMDEGSASGHVHLVDSSGVELAGALHPMPPELWDRSHRRLTVLLEPGRVKRGLQPNAQAGPPLRDGDVVTLVVDAELRDAGGAPLVAGARRSFRVGPPERRRVDPESWMVHWPDGEAQELAVEFDRPLDDRLVARYVRVINRSGRPVPGTAVLDGDGRRWAFTPAAPLGDWRIHAGARLEDLAGNSVRRVFDRDLDDRADDGVGDARVVLRRPPLS